MVEHDGRRVATPSVGSATAEYHLMRARLAAQDRVRGGPDVDGRRVREVRDADSARRARFLASTVVVVVVNGRGDVPEADRDVTPDLRRLVVVGEGILLGVRLLRGRLLRVGSLLAALLRGLRVVRAGRRGGVIAGST